MRRFGVIIVVLCALAASSKALAQAQTSMVFSNGAVAARFNVVVLSEGYTAAQLPQFRVDAINALNSLFSREPFKEYQPYCNAFAVSVASSQSGSDHPSIPRTVSTYFNSTYDLSDKLITIDSVGQSRVEALTSGLNCGLAILLVNDPVKGGSDGGGKTAIASISAFNTLVHEAGHVVANLGDEYTKTVAGAPDIEEPNTTRETDPAKIKWRAWISPGTPIPTPATFDYIDAVGLFEGAHYHTSGWYRPKFQCTMQNDNIFEFCEVCREALTLAISGRVNPIAAWVPGPLELTVTNMQQLSFALALVDPATHAIVVNWSLNGERVAGGRSLSVNVSSLPPGRSSLTAVVQDPTPFVRNDPSRTLFQTNAWTILRLDPLVLAGSNYRDGNFVLTLQGSAPNGSYLEQSTNLLTWVRIATNEPFMTELRWTNSSSPSLPNAYYRAVSRP